MNQSATSDPSLSSAFELHQLGRVSEAIQAYRDLLSREPNNATALHLLGIALIQLARADEAIPPLQQAVTLAPDEAEYHAGLARAHHALGAHGQAVTSMQRAVELAPESHSLWSDLGAMLQTDGRNEHARRAYHMALERNPRHNISRYNLATLAYREGDLSQAVEQLREVVNDNPGQPKLRTTLAGYLLESGSVADALEHCEAALASNPRDLMAMTLKSIALTRLGQLDAARALMDLDILLHSETIAAPAGFADLDAFNSALETHVTAHPTLEYERKANATRGGRHTDNLMRDAERGPIEPLSRIFRRKVQRYLAKLPQDVDHPFLSQRPMRFKIQTWAVVMDTQGHQLAHTHPDGWISGVYYVRIPPQITDDDSRHAGWIEFGRPLPELIADAKPDTRLICPSEGCLVLFPSYVYHRTLPFESDRHRISIAFDAIPY